MVEFVVELIEIPPSSFVVLFFVLLATRNLMFTPKEEMAHVHAAVSWVFFLLLCGVLLKLHRIFISCLPANCPSYTNLPPPGSQLIETYSNSPGSQLLEATIEKPSSRPRFYNDPLRRSNNSIGQCLCGTSAPTKQEALFWFWSNGPRFLATSLQLVLFGQAVCLAVYFKTGEGTDNDVFTLFTVLHWAPFIASFIVLWPSILYYYTIATSTHLMKSQDSIDKTIHHIAKEQFWRYESLILELNTAARVHRLRTLPNALYADWRQIQLQAFRAGMSTHEGDEIKATFDTWDTDNSGSIDRDEMAACLKAQNLSENRIARILHNWFHQDVFRSPAQTRTMRRSQSRHEVKKDNLLLCKDDFCILMLNLQELDEGGCDDEDTEMWIKEVLDSDESGSVSVDEFIDLLGDVCSQCALDRSGVAKLFEIIDAGTSNSTEVESLEVAKLVVWLKNFSATGSHDRRELAAQRKARVVATATPPEKDEEG